MTSNGPRDVSTHRGTPVWICEICGCSGDVEKGLHERWGHYRESAVDEKKRLWPFPRERSYPQSFLKASKSTGTDTE